MKELALHILDLVQNCITAGADRITLDINEDMEENTLSIRIEDNGCGMDEETLKRVIDPFYTTRTTRSVGLGVPMFKVNAEMCGGDFNITSLVGAGTKVDAWFMYDHIDRPPLGDMPNTIVGIVLSLESADLDYFHTRNGKTFSLSTSEMREMLGEDVSLSEVDVLQWVKAYVTEGLTEIGVDSQ
ncbi:MULTISPECIES: ATP-binding protein [unclassified Fusibacter]|uniref:ATP-binding protein n=1 Tax=unclassified Fusibacter TaxID=2624464 RepID=UPI001011EE71|nr:MULTISPECIES: ATP-binding protein [unclassified Fusibacter]MCK8060587.1 ATP-binding protein [Fusibacter sp. A2]NPE22959.1 sensor histidine kinase [Fusibacter sp. A1]RXV60024.1 ATP-binding protein [Fusibacter sp. A1]